MKNTIAVSWFIGIVTTLAICSFSSCKTTSKKNMSQETTNVVNYPQFDADSAYKFVQAQCNFGPRTMNSDAHDKCEKWIANKFRSLGCEVNLQRATLKGYDGTNLKACNIIAKLNPKSTNRILVCAHWDSRPWADNDPNKDNWKKPVLAADDGASGVGVMIELARTISKLKDLNVGIDFVCFDAEDWGTPQWENNNSNDEDTWALGAQYWSKNISDSIKPKFGILLDMVGGRNAKFYIEQASMSFAPEIVAKVWGVASDAGYSNFFINQTGGAITDDHIPVNQIAQIPTIDIIPYYPEMSPNIFGPVWHTINDTMDNIDSKTLKAVGQTVLNVIYNENM